MPEGFIKGVEIVTRWGCCAERVENIEIRAGMDPVPNGFKGKLTVNSKVATFVGPADANLKTYRVDFDEGVLAKYVTLQRLRPRVTLEINEIRMIKGTAILKALTQFKHCKYFPNILLYFLGSVPASIHDFVCVYVCV